MKRKMKSPRENTRIKSAEKHVYKLREIPDEGKLRSFNLLIEEVMKNISALSLA